MQMRKAVKKEVPSAICVPCFDFSVDEYQRERRTVIIAPIILEEIKVGTLQIAWACSRGPYCFDEYCRYSKKSRERDSDNGS